MIAAVDGMSARLRHKLDELARGALRLVGFSSTTSQSSSISLSSAAFVPHRANVVGFMALPLWKTASAVAWSFHKQPILTFFASYYTGWLAGAQAV
jgi:hypothetical protein